MKRKVELHKTDDDMPLFFFVMETIHVIEGKENWKIEAVMDSEGDKNHRCNQEG